MRVRIPPRALLTIRPATPDDARALAEVHVASWRVGYRGLIPDRYLARLSVDEREEMWKTIVAGDESTVLLAGDGERVDGLVAFVPATREIRALYVAPARFGQGIGSALLEAAHAQLGDHDSALWVLDGNERALRFYARHGYAPDGATTIHQPTGLTELRLTRQSRE